VRRNCPECSTDARVMIANKLKKGIQIAKRWQFQQDARVCSVAPRDSILSIALS
jgi:hypothetical protein